MGLETPFDYIDDMDAANPLATNNDPLVQGDDHLRGIKRVVQNHLGGTATVTQLKVNGVVVTDLTANTFKLTAPAGSGAQLDLCNTDLVPPVTGDVGRFVIFVSNVDNSVSMRSYGPGSQFKLRWTRPNGSSGDLFDSGTDGHTAVISPATNQTRRTGVGSPEGVVTAPPGSDYLNSLGGAGQTYWVKESGTGNTGWVAK